MEVAGLRSPLNEATDYSAYADRMEKLGEPYEYGDDNSLLKIIREYLKQNSATIKQAIASKLANSKISGELKVSRDEFADAILNSRFSAADAAGSSAIVSWVNRGSGRETTDELAKILSQPGLKSYAAREVLGKGYGEDYGGLLPKDEQWYEYADKSEEEYNKKVSYMRRLSYQLERTLKALKGDNKVLSLPLLYLYVINTQGGSEASTWELDKDSAKYTKWIPEFKKLLDAKGEQAAAELIQAHAAGFDAWVELAMSDDFAKYLAKNPPKGRQKSVSIDGKQAAKELKKDATLKGEFEKWLVDTLEMGGATREDLIADYGDGMNLDPMDLDMDDIVSNIINNKKYSDDLGEFFSEYKGSLNESIFEQITKVKKQLWK
jgi:hypothetical protein